MRQNSFSELEYSAKRKQTRRDRFLAEIEAITPWSELVQVLEPFFTGPASHAYAMIAHGGLPYTLKPNERLGDYSHG